MGAVAHRLCVRRMTTQGRGRFALGLAWVLWTLTCVLGACTSVPAGDGVVPPPRPTVMDVATLSPSQPARDSPGTVCWEGNAAVAQTVLVGMAPGHYDDLDSIAAQLPGGRAALVYFGGKIGLLRFDGTQITLSEAIATLEADARVRYAEPNYLVSLDGAVACGPETEMGKSG